MHLLFFTELIELKLNGAAIGIIVWYLLLTPCVRVLNVLEGISYNEINNIFISKYIKVQLLAIEVFK